MSSLGACFWYTTRWWGRFHLSDQLTYLCAIYNRNNIRPRVNATCVGILYLWGSSLSQSTCYTTSVSHHRQGRCWRYSSRPGGGTGVGVTMSATLNCWQCWLPPVSRWSPDWLIGPRVRTTAASIDIMTPLSVTTCSSRRRWPIGSTAFWASSKACIAVLKATGVSNGEFLPIAILYRWFYEWLIYQFRLFVFKVLMCSLFRWCIRQISVLFRRNVCLL